MVYKKNVDILTTLNEDALTSNDTFTYRNGLNIAAAFTAYDGETESILDPSYGEIAFKHMSWGEDPEDGSFFVKREKKKEHVCSREELGLTENKEETRFMPIVPSHRTYLDIYQKKFICLDEEDLFVYGDVNSDKGSVVSF